MTVLDGVRNPREEWVPGVVEFHRWHRPPWTDRAAMGVAGVVRIVSSDDAVGFTIAGDNQANWVALVLGPTGTVMAVPGCQVATVTFDCKVGTSDVLEVP